MAVPGWQIDGSSVLACGAARVAIQRIGLAHWQPATRLRSWGIAPLHGEATRVSVPCADDEALWVGLWSEEASVAAELCLVDTQSGAQASACTELGSTAITALGSPARQTQLEDTAPQSRPCSFEPLTRLGSPERCFRVHLEAGTCQVRLELCLLTPADWAARAGRPEPAALSGPPPLPPQLG